MSKKYILGGGISGLIFSYFNPGYTIISPEIGGKLSQDFMSNTIYLHETPDTLSFVEELGVNYKKRTHTIKYVKGGVVKRDINIVDKLAMVRKKLDDKEFTPQDYNLSTSDYYISTLKVDWKEIIQKLKEKANIIEDTVIRITDKEIVTEKTTYEYNEIISTLSAKIFWSLYHKPTNIELKSKSVTFVLANEIPKVLENETFDMVYFLDDKFKYTRINQYYNSYLYEFTNELSLEEVKQYLPKDANIIKYHVDKDGIIYTNRQNIPPPNIRFISRFAQWDHSIKINDVIKESKFSYDFRHIFNRQLDFFNKVEGLNNVLTIEQKEKTTHSMILHLLDEISEILNETNYKRHKLHIDVDVAKVRGEIIDVFKYLLTLAIVWDMDMRKVVEEFNKKSDTVEKRWEELRKNE